MCSIILEHSDKDLNENLKEMPDDRITWSKKEWLRVHPLSNLIFWHSDQFNKTQSHARIRDFIQLAGKIFEILLAVLSRIIRNGQSSFRNANVKVPNRTLPNRTLPVLDMNENNLRKTISKIAIYRVRWPDSRKQSLTRWLRT